MEGILGNFTQLVNDNLLIALGASFLAGLLSSLSPCAIAAIPLIIGYVGGYAGDNQKRALGYSLVFCLGLVVTFTTLGALSAIVGKMAIGSGDWWFFVLGGVMTVVGMEILGVIKLKVPFPVIKQGKKGIIGAFFMGLLGGVFSTPCATPVLVIILTIVAGQQQMLLGVVMLAAYAVGHCAVVLLCGASVGFVQGYLEHPRSQNIAGAVRWITGLIALALAAYMFYLGM